MKRIFLFLTALCMMFIFFVAESFAADRVLVAYFSATGTTKKLAEYAAAAMGADLFEIVPETPYSDADLNWHDRNGSSAKVRKNYFT